VERGEVFGLVGPDGAGKTTTLRVLCGLLEPSAGSVRVAGFQVSKEVEAVKDRIGYMAQRFGLYADLTVEENMIFYADLFGVPRSERDTLLPDLLRMTRMEPFRKRLAGKLSGGMKQKLALMCTLLHRPQILFLDEPTNGVDPVSRRDFWTVLYKLVKEGMTVFVTTVYLDEAERCDRVGLMHRGRLIRCDSPQKLMNTVDEECYEIRCRDPRRVKALLQDHDGVVSIEPAGAVLHAFLEKGVAQPDLQRVIDEAGLGPAHFQRITPSLEDVFIALIRRETNART
jgi:ABC-2 type transport system ATP-binding protein